MRFTDEAAAEAVLAFVMNELANFDGRFEVRSKHNRTLHTTIAVDWPEKDEDLAKKGLKVYVDGRCYVMLMTPAADARGA